MKKVDTAKIKVVIRVKNNAHKYFQIMRRTNEPCGLAHMMPGRLFWSMQAVEETCKANRWVIVSIGDDWEILG